MPNTFWRGRKTRVIFDIDNTKIPLVIQKWSVEEEAVDHDDGICGEDRNRKDRTVTGYAGKMDILLEDLKPIKALITNTQNDDAGVESLAKSITWAITHQGITEGFQAGGQIVVKWNLDVGGMPEPGKTTITWRSQYFTTVQR